MRLFTRISRGLQLTPEGEGLQPILNQSFDTIASTLDSFLSGRERVRLKVGVVGFSDGLSSV